MEKVENIHKPVMLKEVIHYLNLSPGKIVVDATLGLGGHSSEILRELRGEGLLIGIDRDEEVLELARERLSKIASNFVLFNTTYDNLQSILKELNLSSIDAILFDLGFSSFHVEKSGRGFSFMRPEEPLDMRYSKDTALTAADILNTFSESELSNLFWEYGEEPLSKKLAKKIVERRKDKKFAYVGDLLEVIDGVIPRRRRHEATKVFQALRIAVNDELNILKRALEQVPFILSIGGRIVVITYHSLEDRIVKNFFKSYSDKILPVSKRVIKPSMEEIKENRRARSAKLRVGERRENS
uniref:Ribosomal RNA small subunit methyltransferase H n=1 Tax=Dictyoglomus thermophilum TaxID=14 RepID=A0A7V4DXI9_DICTH